MDVWANFLDNAPLGCEFFADLDACFFAGQAIKLGSGIGNASGLVHDGRHVQVVAQAKSVVIRVVCWGDLDGTGAELWVDVIISNNLQAQVIAEWVRQGLSDQILVALIVWVHGNSDVAEHGFHTGGGNNDMWFIVVEGTIANGYQFAFDILVDNFDVRNRGF